MSGEKILVIDDEPEIVELITIYLQREGYQVFSENSGQKALELVDSIQPDLIILDILLPGMDGFEICQTLRKSYRNPILFISCKQEDKDIVFGLGIGGDDYMTKPFSPSQMVARVKAQLRRNKFAETMEILRFPGLEINITSHTVLLNGQSVLLSMKEFDLLVHLAKYPDRVIPLDQLFQTVWSLDSMGDTRTLLVHISNLRKKIEADPAEPKYIYTVRGIGYKFIAAALAD